MRKGVCKYCGKEFEYSSRGRQRTYCRDEECIRKSRNEAKRKWYSKKVNKTLDGCNMRIVEKDNSKPKVIYSSRDRVDNRINEDFSDILNVARELGAVRYKLTQMLEKQSKIQSYYDKEDQDFLHKIENLEELTDEEAINIIVTEKKKRDTRRGNKLRLSIIQKLLAGIIRNPNQYVVERIKNRDNFEYNQRIKNESEDKNELQTQRYNSN